MPRQKLFLNLIGNEQLFQTLHRRTNSRSHEQVHEIQTVKLTQKIKNHLL